MSTFSALEDFVADPLDQAGASSQLPRPHATSGATSTSGTAADLQTAHVPYQPRTGAYPYAIGAWGYHYPQFPSATVSSSVTGAGATQGDSVANIMASGTFPYAYTAAQYTPGQPAYVPPVKYPYGAPAMPAVSSPSAGATPTSSTAQTQERPYSGIQWKRPYEGPRDSTPAVEPQSQSESTGANAADESTQIPNKVVTSSDIVPSTDKPAPTSSTAGVTA